MMKRVKCNRETLREEIVEKAAEAFLKNGIRVVRMDDIANSLSISKRTLYELFSDKEQLLMEVFCLLNKRTTEYMSEIASRADNVLEVIFAFNKRKMDELGSTNPAFLRDLRKYPKVINYVRESHKNADKEAFAYFKKGIEQGIFRADINFEIINQATLMQLEMLIYSDLTESYPLDEIYGEITVLHMRGITTEKGLKMVDSFLRSVKENL